MDIDRYRTIREACVQLNSYILKGLKKTDTRIAARALGVMKGNKVVLANEEDIDRVYDFFVNDYRNPDGMTLVECFHQAHSDLSEDEQRVLEGLLHSSSSLFRITDVNSADKTIELENLLSPDHRITVMDLGLSSVPDLKGLLMFSRIVSLPEVNMTSGAPLLFEPYVEELLLGQYPKKMAKITVGDESMKRAAAFFRLYQRYGLQELGYR